MFFKLPWAMRALIYKLFFKKVGWLSYLGCPIFLKGVRNISIGNKVRIFPHFRMEAYGTGIIKIEDNCSIGQGLHVIASESVVISKSTTISFGVMVTDSDHCYENIGVPIFDQPLKVRSTHIGENCFIGAGVKIQAGTRLGKHCIVGANSVVRGEFPDYSVIVGSPAKIVKRFNLEKKMWEKV